MQPDRPHRPRPADATVASPAYQQILAVFHTATAPMRAKDICRALGTGTTAKNTEGLRAKLNRLVARQILTEAEAGLVTLASPTPSPVAPPAGPFINSQTHNGQKLPNHPLRHALTTKPTA